MQTCKHIPLKQNDSDRVICQKCNCYGIQSKGNEKLSIGPCIIWYKAKTIN